MTKASHGLINSGLFSFWFHGTDLLIETMYNKEDPENDVEYWWC